MDPVSTKSKSWFDEIIWKQLDLSMGFPSVEQFSEMTGEIAYIPRSRNCFLTPKKVLYSKSDPTSEKMIPYFFLFIGLVLNSGYPNL